MTRLRIFSRPRLQAPAAMSMLDSVVEEEERRLPRGSSSEAMQPQLYILGALDQLQLYVGGTVSWGWGWGGVGVGVGGNGGLSDW